MFTSSLEIQPVINTMRAYEFTEQSFGGPEQLSIAKFTFLQTRTMDSKRAQSEIGGKATRESTGSE